MLEETLESLSDCKEIQPVHPSEDKLDLAKDEKINAGDLVGGVGVERNRQ